MNSENFPDFLNDPTRLYSVSFEELQSLVLEYPYANSLWKLLLCKAYFEDKTEYPKILESLAIRIQNRSQLRNFVAHLAQLKAEYELAQENRQTLDLEDFKRQVIHRAIQEVPPAEKKQEKAQQAEVQPVEKTTERKQLLDELFGSETDIDVPKESQEEKPTEESDSVDLITAALSEHIAASIEVQLHLAALPAKTPSKKKAKKKKKHKPQSKDNFDSWHKAQQAFQFPTKSGQSVKAKALAAQSIMYNTSIISETLAKLLEDQGYFDKSIKMYEQLCLKNPEKSALFEAKINSLKERR